MASMMPAATVLGRDATEARDDGGHAAWLGAHLLFAHTIHRARAHGRLLAAVPGTRLVRLCEIPPKRRDGRGTRRSAGCSDSRVSDS